MVISCNDQNITIQNNKFQYEDIITEQLRNNSIEINPNLQLTDINNIKKSISEIIGDKTMMIIRSSEKGCGMCIEKELNRIKTYVSKLGRNNIVLITTHNSTRKLEVFKKVNNIDFDMYYCESLDIPCEEKSEKAFMFTLGKDLCVRNFFLPKIGFPTLTEKYYAHLIDNDIL